LAGLGKPRTGRETSEICGYEIVGILYSSYVNPKTTDTHSLRRREKIVVYNYPEQAAGLISRARNIMVLTGMQLFQPLLSES